jgi:hypothetical protein
MASVSAQKPASWAGYIRRFGFCEAVLVHPGRAVSSGDEACLKFKRYAHNMTFPAYLSFEFQSTSAVLL